MEDSQYDSLFAGDFDDLISLPKRVVRLFISSTFTDMTLERNSLMEHVYPRLKKYCRERHGLDFQVVDMRWGVRDEATDDHQTATLCSREIENCQRMSLGPNFVALIGDKYGFRPLCNKIKSVEFRAIRRSLIQLDINTDFLDVWYKEDLNATPEEYVLQPISTILKNFTNKAEPDLQSIDQRIWSAIQQRIHELLFVGSSQLVKHHKMSHQEQSTKYSISVTEREVIEGCLNVKEAKQHCLVFVRCILDLRIKLDECLAKLSPHQTLSTALMTQDGGSQTAATDSSSTGSDHNKQQESQQHSTSTRKDSQTRRASLKIGDDTISLSTSGAQNAGERKLEKTRRLIGRYMDLKCKDNVWSEDFEAQELLASLRDRKLSGKLKLDGRNLSKFKLLWFDPDGMSLKCDEHKHYLAELNEHLYSNLTRMIRKAGKQEKSLKSGLVGEVLHHSHYAKHVSRGFHGRDQELERIKCYVMQPRGIHRHGSGQLMPMFVYGVGGSGKTSLLAKTATLVKNWFKLMNQAARVVVAGAVSQTTNNPQASNFGAATSARSGKSQSTSGNERWNERPCIIVRFCCTTPSSSSMLDVLTSVCNQLQFNFYQYGPLNGATRRTNLQPQVGPTGNRDHDHYKADYDETATSDQDEQLAYKPIPDDFVRLVFSFRQLLDNCRHKLHQKRLFVIILDAIERLSSPSENSIEAKFSWLTSIANLPPNVRLIVSCTSDANERLQQLDFLHLKRHFLQSYFLLSRKRLAESLHLNGELGVDLDVSEYSSSYGYQGYGGMQIEIVGCEDDEDSNSNSGEPLNRENGSPVSRDKDTCSAEREQQTWILHVKPLGVELAIGVMRNWLSDSGRKLSQQQWSLVERSFKHCSRPIFVKLAFGEVINWKSYSMQSDAKGLTFGSALLKQNSRALRQVLVGSRGPQSRDHKLQMLLEMANFRFESASSSRAQELEEQDDLDDELAVSNELKWQILAIEQDWLNYVDYKQRKTQIVATNEPQSTNGQVGTADATVTIKIDAMAGMAKASSGATASSMASSGGSICHLSQTIDDAIRQLFARIELQHGFILTKHSLSYITAARNGICENELEDILSLDDVVLDDVFQYHLPPVRRIPPLLWTRIRNDLPDYLSERDADGIVVNWHHNQFKQVTQSRYLADKYQLVYVHSIMADYFLGKWSNKPKPFRCTRQQIQMAAEQLDSAIQQSLRESQGGGSFDKQQHTSSFSQHRPSVSSGSISRLNCGQKGSAGWQAGSGQPMGSFYVGSRSRIRGSDLHDQRMQLMQAKADRRVPSQPLYYELAQSSHSSEQQASDQLQQQQQQTSNCSDGKVVQLPDKQDSVVALTERRRYNLRKLTELPYHLVRSCRFLELATGVLFNYKWLFAALDAMGVQCLLADFEDAIRGLEAALDTHAKQQDRQPPARAHINIDAMDIELRTIIARSEEFDAQDLASMVSQLRKLNDAVRLSCSTLHSDTQMLAPQLIGRLLAIVKQGQLNAESTTGVKSVTPVSVNYLSQLLEQCDKDGAADCALVPTDHCLQSPDGMQLSSLEGHPRAIAAMCLAGDQRHMLAVSNKFIMWDITTGQISRFIDPQIQGSMMRQLKMGQNSEFAIAYTNDDLLLVLDTLTQQVIKYYDFCHSTHDPQLSTIEGIELIDRFGASKFLVWHKQGWSVMQVVNNELVHSVSMNERVSIELVYRLDLAELMVSSNLTSFERILSVKQSSRMGRDGRRDISFVEVQSSKQTADLISLITVESNLTTSGEWQHSLWTDSIVGATTMALDLHLTRVIYSDFVGNVYLRRKRQSCWSNAKFLLNSNGNKQIDSTNSIDDMDEFELQSMRPLAIELDSMSSSMNEQRSQSSANLTLDYSQDLDELIEFESRIDNLSGEADEEIQPNKVFRSELEGQHAELKSGYKPRNRVRKRLETTGNLKTMRLYMMDEIIVYKLSLDYTGSEHIPRREFRCKLPKSIQNLSIEPNKCQVCSCIVGDEFLVASSGKKLLFYSIADESLLRCFDGHNARIVQLMPVVSFGSTANLDYDVTDQKKPSAATTELMVASASMDKTVKIWKLSNVYKHDEPIDRLPDSIESMSVCGQQHDLVGCLSRTEFAVWHWPTMKVLARMAPSDLRLSMVDGGSGSSRSDDCATTSDQNDDDSASVGCENLNSRLKFESKILKCQFSSNGQYMCLARELSLDLYKIQEVKINSNSKARNLNLNLNGQFAPEANSTKASKDEQNIDTNGHQDQTNSNNNINNSTAATTSGDATANFASLRGSQSTRLEFKLAFTFECTTNRAYRLKFLYHDSRLLAIVEASNADGRLTSSSLSKANDGPDDDDGEDDDADDGDEYDDEDDDGSRQLVVHCLSVPDGELMFSITSLRVPLASSGASSGATDGIGSSSTQKFVAPTSSQRLLADRKPSLSTATTRRRRGRLNPQRRTFGASVNKTGDSDLVVPLLTLDGQLLVCVETSTSVDQSLTAAAAAAADLDVEPSSNGTRSGQKYHHHHHHHRRPSVSKATKTSPSSLKQQLHLHPSQSAKTSQGQPKQLQASGLKQPRQLQRVIKVYSTRDGQLVRTIDFARLEVAPRPSPRPASGQLLPSLTTTADHSNQSHARPPNHPKVANANSKANSSTTEQPQGPMANFRFSRLKTIAYRERQSVVGLIDDDSGQSYLIDVQGSQLLASCSFWNGKLSSDGRSGLTWMFKSPPSESAPASASNSSGEPPNSGLPNSSGLHLVDMQRLNTPSSAATASKCLLSNQRLTKLSGSELLVGSSSNELDLLCGFTKTNDSYVYYYDSRTNRLLLVKIANCKLVANYKLANQVTTIKCSPDGYAILLGQADGSLCSLAIADPEKSDSMARLAQYSSRRRTN